MKFFIGCSDTLSRQRGSIIRANASHAANTHSYLPFPQGVALGYRDLQTYGLHTIVNCQLSIVNCNNGSVAASHE